LTVRWGANVRLNVQFPSSWTSFLLSWVFPNVHYTYVIRNLYNFYNLTSCENVPETSFSITTHYYIYFPITTQFPVQTLRPCVVEAASPLPDCPEGYIYVSRTPYCTLFLTSSLPLNVRQPNNFPTSPPTTFLTPSLYTPSLPSNPLYPSPF
jgi:hypothetical protein